MGILGAIGAGIKGVGSALATGFEIGSGNIGSAARITALTSRFGGIAGSAAVGAGAGAWYGSISNQSPSTTEGAVAGAAMGAAALPAVGAAGGLGWAYAKNLDKVGSTAFSVARGAGKVGSTFLGTLNSTNSFMNPLGNLANGAKKIMGSMVTHTPAVDTWNAKKGVMETKGGGLKLSGWGKMAVGTSVIAQGVFGAKRAFEESRMGTMDGYVTTANPRMPDYNYEEPRPLSYRDRPYRPNDGGATGDLVFALNANRRG